MSLSPFPDSFPIPLLRLRFRPSRSRQGFYAETATPRAGTREPPGPHAPTRSVECVERDSTVEDLCEIFGYKPYKKIPVVDDGKLVGVVVRSDLIRQSVDGYLEQAA